MTFRRVEVLEVRAWGSLVGAVTQLPDSPLAVFEYNRAWRGPELSPLLMARSPRRRTWTFPGLSLETFHGLPPLLAGSVPDDFGNAVITAALLREGLQRADVRPIDRLAYVGTRAMGALTFHPAQSPKLEATALEMAQLVEGARRAIRGSLAEDQRSETVNEILSVGVSAGGARAKAIIAFEPESGEVRVGGIDAPEGFEQWLIKFDGVGEDRELGTGGDFGRIEYAYSLMARQAGIEMAECRLLEEADRAHFMTRRFDRPGVHGERLHLQSLNDLLGLDFRQRVTHGYESLFQADAELQSGAAEQIFRRMVFNVLGSNHDDHTKNHAFLLSQEGSWRLSPAYDLSYAYNPQGFWTSQHLMGVNGKFAQITRADLLGIADRYRVPGASRVLREVAAAVAEFTDFARAAGVSKTRTQQIERRLRELRDESGA
ncbi:type II toxin-antitoxin system HipA family toxin [Leucobacter insecticola]|uniref:Type II toxin-antitoxin system HipA family toxin n=1 Tax=Leucobacter insecticola TaxID=2714934 RepID=A0A6G8FJT7_9MICO|nr:type II toxin-antitoxin system HipA family toxin [Leucobacter insecticola]QIM16549.1 type II toxin-antitoxin system HipA family toxin [Leucobacter insecticola]